MSSIIISLLSGLDYLGYFGCLGGLGLGLGYLCTYGFNSSKSVRVIFSNKYECKNPYEAQAWLCVSHRKNDYYIYPFSYMDHCNHEIKKYPFSTYVVFNYSRIPIISQGFNTRKCEKIGKYWLQNNFIRQQGIILPHLPHLHDLMNNILTLSKEDKYKILEKLTEEYVYKYPLENLKEGFKVLELSKILYPNY